MPLLNLIENYTFTGGMASGKVSNPSYDNPGGKGDRIGTIIIATTLTVGGSTAKLIDGLTIEGGGTGFYFGTQAASGKYLSFDFGLGTSKLITEAKQWQASANDTQGIWRWQGSNDNSAWTNIGGTFTLGGFTTGNPLIITSLSGNSSGYRYYRILGVSGNTSDNPWQMEFEFKIDNA